MLKVIYEILERRYGSVQRRMLLDKVDGHARHAKELRLELKKLRSETSARIESEHAAAKNWMNRYNRLNDKYLNEARRDSDSVIFERT